MKLRIKDGVLLRIKIKKRDEQVVIPNSVICIGNHAFYGSRKKVRQIQLPDSIKYIEHSAFSHCEKIKKINLPTSIKSIAKYAFYECSELEEIVIPPLVNVIESRTFDECISLKKVVLPDGLKEIDYSAFEKCVMLKEIELPSSLKIIGDSVFGSCIRLEKISLPPSIEYIGIEAFFDCDGLKEIELPPLLKIINNGTFSFCRNLEKVKMSNLVETIEQRAFRDCRKLSDVQFSSSLKYIEYYAFENCGSLEQIVLPNSVKEIEICAFKCCENLKSVKLNYGLKKIGRECFAECHSLEKIEIPSTVNGIGYDAFLECNNLKEIKLCNVYNLLEEGIDCLIEDFPYYYYNKENGELIMSKKAILNLEGYKEINYNIKMSNDEKWKKAEKIALLIIFEGQKLNKLKYISTILPNIARDTYGSFDYEKLKEYKEFYNLKKKFKNLDNMDVVVYYDLFKLACSLGAFSEDKVDRQRACEFISNAFDKNNFNFKTIHGMFESLDYREYNKEWAEFFMNKNNFVKLLQLEKDQNGFIARVCNNFEEIKEFGRSNRGSQRYRKVTIEMSREYLSKTDFIGVSEENFDIAEEISKYTHIQDSFDRAKGIREEYVRLKAQRKIKDHILNEELIENEIEGQRENILNDVQDIFNNLYDIANEKFSYEFLSKYDPKNFTLGKYCCCCAHLEGVGYGIMKASILHPDCQNLVIKNENGVIIAKSTLYINKNYGYGVFNNVEINSSYMKKEDRKKIYEKYKKAIESFVKRYNELNADNPIKQINVGMNLNDLSEEIIKNNIKSKKILKAIDFKEYDGRHEGDWQEEQYVMWSDREVKNKNGR